MTHFRRLACILVLAAFTLAARQAAADELLVFAAASLKNALDAADAAYQQKTGTKIVASYAASGPLAKQIENGAPADIFISADLGWMDYVAERHLIKPATRVNLLANRLVLVAAKDDARKVEIVPGFPLATLLGDSRLAVGDPASVPAGQYGKQALEKLGVWTFVQAKLAMAADVRGAMTLVSRGEAPFGIVYETDVVADPGVRIAAFFPPDSYPPITYPIAATVTARPAAESFLAWLHSPEPAPFFAKQGFSVLK